MKANRKFVQADEAVSPVIAVILMVAITVVLAATVFVLVSDIGGNTGSSTPAVSWAPDESTDRMTVNTAAQNADWNRLTVQVDSCTQAAASSAVGRVGTDTPAYQNEAGVVGGAALNVANAGVGSTTCGAPVAVEVTNAAAKMTAGDYLEFCSSPAAGLMTNIKITIKDTVANAIVTSHTFTNWDNC